MERIPTPTPSGGTTPTLPTQRVTYTAWQGTYGAYGEVLTAEYLRASPKLHLGHKGLFVDRLDGSVADEITGEEIPRLEPGAQHLYYARNRTYSPTLGRWLQKDPNSTGSVLLGFSSFHGLVPAGTVDGINLTALYIDGLGLFDYVGGSAWNSRDPLGLMVGMGSMVDIYADSAIIALRLSATLVGIYTENLEHDAEWAGDWSMPDDWHTRGDGSWIKDVYDEINVDKVVDDFLPGLVGLEADDLPAMASSTGALLGTAEELREWNRAARRWNQQGKVAHHIISFYKNTAKRFKDLQIKHDFEFSLWQLDNLSPIVKDQHRGRHRKIYHDRVFDHLEKSLAGKEGNAATAALMEAMAYLKKDIAANPGKWFNP